MLADDVADYLTTGGMTVGIYSGEMPARPLEAMVLTPIAGVGPMRTMGGLRGEQVRVQLRVRSTTYPLAEALMATADRLLTTFAERDLNSRRYYDISGSHSPMYMGLTEEDLPIFTCNYDIWRAAAT